MGDAKAIELRPIGSQVANALVKRLHYSGKVAANSQLHLGVFLDGRLEGALQFGPSMDKRKIQTLVAGTPWNGFLELNRMAFSDKLPRNSESRALAVAFRLIRKHYPHVQWVVSFADGTQSGDGTIYRASGFVLTGIRKNTTIWGNEEGAVVANISVHAQPTRKTEILNRLVATDTRRPGRQALINRVAMEAQGTKGASAQERDLAIRETGKASMAIFKQAGFAPLPGYQLRYVYFLDPTARARLSVPALPFSKIDELGARMYLGKARAKQAMAGHPPDQRRGSTDPHAPISKTRTPPAPDGQGALGRGG